MGNRVYIPIRGKHGHSSFRVFDNYDEGQWKNVGLDWPSSDTDPIAFVSRIIDQGDDVLDAALENGTYIYLGADETSVAPDELNAYRVAKKVSSTLEEELPVGKNVKDRADRHRF